MFIATDERRRFAQASWENPLNVIPMFTEEDKAAVADKREKGKEEMGIKTVARRFEHEIVKVSPLRRILCTV